jgi:predicted enzyme related to lactoylglutathione lyase
MEFNALVPELYVSDYSRSLDFYVGVLGFKVEYTRNKPDFALLSYEKAQLMIQQQEKDDEHTDTLERPYGRGINFQIETADLRSLIAKLKQKTIRCEKTLRSTGAGWEILCGVRLKFKSLILMGISLDFRKLSGTSR